MLNKVSIGKGTAALRAALFSHKPLHQSMHSPFNGLDYQQTSKA